MKTAQQTLQETYVTLEQVEEMIHNAKIKHETEIKDVLLAPHTIITLRELGYRVDEGVRYSTELCNVGWGPAKPVGPRSAGEFPISSDVTRLSVHIPPQPPAWMYITIGVLVLAIIIVYIFKIHL